MVRHTDEVPIITLEGDDLKDVKKQVLVSPEDGFNGFLRMFIVEKGGYTPYHKHNWYHLNYVVEGEGVVVIEDVEYKLKRGSVAYIPPQMMHSFRNTSDKNLRFLCLIPEERPDN
ncbi:MAG: hypothetical protein B5M53_05900 [Candidatus Cloacimonas sp. 4484_209]|nr:MAG: hypothetical protein B5M53_05900 [Candidatus Cloacimonas sp. 4484_209]